MQRLGVVTHHLFREDSDGVFLPLERLDDRALLSAYRELSRQTDPSPVAGEEGVQKELQRL
jgi:hypothetical protein